MQEEHPHLHQVHLKSPHRPPSLWRDQQLKYIHFDPLFFLSALYTPDRIFQEEPARSGQ